MSQELIAKIEEKLGGAIDLITFDNAQQVADYLSRYIQLKNLITTLFTGAICIICIVVALIEHKRAGKADWGDPDFPLIICVVATIIGLSLGIVFISCLYDTIIAYIFPMAAIAEWLK